MVQKDYEGYVISIDGSDGKFVITSIKNKETKDKIESANKSTEFKSEEDALNAAKQEIDKKLKDKPAENKENTDVAAEESSFDTLFNKILMENNLVDEWKKVIVVSEDSELPDDVGYESDPVMTEDEEDDKQKFINSVIDQIKNAKDEAEQKKIINDIKDNKSDKVNDLVKALQDRLNNLPKDADEKDAEELQKIVEYAQK